MTRNPHNLPTEVRFCARCVISNQRPCSVVEREAQADAPKATIAFDADGVCSACRYADIKTKIDWETRGELLRDLATQVRSKSGNYDCIVPGSGGKDSVFAAHKLREYGFNPLTVTWAPHIYTDVGWRNMQRWQRDFDNVLVTPRGSTHRLLTRLAFLNLVHPFQPFVIGQRQIGPRIAAQYGVPLVFYGENPAEYGNDIKGNDSPFMDREFFVGANLPEYLTLGGLSGAELMRKHGVTSQDLQPYLPTGASAARGIDVHYLGYYLRWDPQEAYYLAAAHGFEANTERTEGSYSKYSSIDDKIDPLMYFCTLAKFGIGRATYDASQEIRNGKIERDEGVALVRRYDQEVPMKYLPEILEYMGISAELFWATLDAARPDHLWENVNGAWRLRHQVAA